MGEEGNEMADKEKKQCLKRPEVESLVTSEEEGHYKAGCMSAVAKYIGV